MAYKGISVDEVREYISPKDPDPSHPTVWQLGTLDNRVKSYIEDFTTSFEVSSEKPTDQARVSLNLNQRNILIVRFGLRGWSNFVDHRNQPVTFEAGERLAVGNTSYQVVSQRLIDLMPYPLLKELAEQIWAQNTLTQEDRRNLSSPSTSSG